MSEELGKIQKPSVEELRQGKKLYFVPLIYCGKEAPSEYVEKYNDYWKQVEDQISNLELKLGNVQIILHEFITANGEEGARAIKELNAKTYEIVHGRIDKGAQIKALENSELVAELMDWSRCISVGLQSQKASNSVYDSYIEISKSRNAYIAQQIKETLDTDEIGLLFMREEHQIQFPHDIEVFYVAPPGLDEIKRWLRDSQAKQEEEAQDNKK